MLSCRGSRTSWACRDAYTILLKARCSPDPLQLPSPEAPSNTACAHLAWPES